MDEHHLLTDLREGVFSTTGTSSKQHGAKNQLQMESCGPTMIML